MTSHAEAKTIVDALGLTPEQSLAVRLVGLHETHYGDGWKGEGVGSNNWGAVTAPAGGNVFQHKDSRFDDATGKVVEYVTNFQRYPTPSDGARGLANVLLMQRGQNRDNITQALAHRSILELATAMRVNKYYLGIKPFNEAIADYHSALIKAYKAIQAATGETIFDAPLAAAVAAAAEALPDLSSYSPQAPSSWSLASVLPPLRQNVRGDLVAVMQHLLGLDPTELFDQETDRAVRAFQAVEGLKVDGICGPQTWFRLFELGTTQAPGDGGAQLATFGIVSPEGPEDQGNGS